jgi:hypothetical protein
MIEDEAIEHKKARVKAMVERMMQAYGVDKKQLAIMFDCKGNVINNWIYYGRIPLEQLEQCRHSTGVTLDWLMYGEAPKPELTDQNIKELKFIMEGLITGAVDYSIITLKYKGAIEQLMDKLEVDVSKWLRNKTTTTQDVEVQPEKD